MLLEKLPTGLKDDAVAEKLRKASCLITVDIIHLIFRPRTQPGSSKDYDFRRGSVLGHWRAAFSDAKTTLDAAPWKRSAPVNFGVWFFDVLKDNARR